MPIAYLNSPLRLAAKAAGEKLFDPQVPCCNNHISPRRTSNGTCVACVNSYRERKGLTPRLRSPLPPKPKRIAAPARIREPCIQSVVRQPVTRPKLPSIGNDCSIFKLKRKPPKAALHKAHIDAAALVREQEDYDLDYELSRRAVIKESIASRARGIALDKLVLARADALLQTFRARAQNAELSL